MPSAASVAGFAATFYNTPIFLWGATVSSSFADKSLYPTVVNLNVNTNMSNIHIPMMYFYCPNSFRLSLAVQSVITQFGWYEIAFIYIPDNERMYGAWEHQNANVIVYTNKPSFIQQAEFKQIFYLSS